MRDNAFAPRKAHVERAIKRLPGAHRQAQLAGITHAHRLVTEAAEGAGLDSGPLRVFQGDGAPYVGIENGPNGDALFDHEFGTPESAPNPVLRTTLQAAHPAVGRTYADTLWRGLGL